MRQLTVSAQRLTVVGSKDNQRRPFLPLQEGPQNLPEIGVRDRDLP